MRTRSTRPAAPASRQCQRCGHYGQFSQPYHQQKVCDTCRADPASRARSRAASTIMYWRARNAALGRLVEAHRDEFEAMLAEERETLGRDWRDHATVREVDDFERRREEAQQQRLKAS